MNFSDAIAAFALLTSVTSGVVSYRTMKIARASQEFEATIAFERDKSELLMYIEQSRNHFSAAVREIERLHFVVQASSPDVQRALSSYQNLFSDFLPRVVVAERQASKLWDEVFEWRDKSGRSSFAHHTPRFRSLVDNDRVVYDSAMTCISEVHSQLKRAKMMFDHV